MLNTSGTKFRRLAMTLILAMGLAYCPMALGADFPTLGKMDEEVRTINQQITQSVLKAQLPLPIWMREQAMNMGPMRQWNDMMDPQLRQMLEQWRDMSIRGGDPGWMSARFPEQGRGGGGVGFDRSGGFGGMGGGGMGGGGMGGRGPGFEGFGRDGGRPPGGDRVDGNYPNSSVIVLDDQGYVLAALYIEPQAARDNQAYIRFNDEKISAKFVGSDDRTQLSLFKLEKPVGKPLVMKGSEPPKGSLTICYYHLTGKSSLSIWNGPDLDIYEVFTADGSFAGIARYNQFLASGNIGPVVSQLMQNGKVNRATLGVKLSEFTPRDNYFRKLGVERPGLIVDDVGKGSLAEKAEFKKNDVIYELNGQPVADLTTWAAMMAAKGESKIAVIREGKKVELKADFSPPDKPEPEKPQPEKPQPPMGGRGGMGGGMGGMGGR